MNNATQPVGQTPSLLESFIPVFLMILVFYFLMVRPQQKREARKKAMLSDLKRGDRVVTLSGIIGTVHKVISNNEISLEISQGVRIRVLKSSVSDIVSKDSPLNQELQNDTDEIPQSDATPKIITDAASETTPKARASMKSGEKLGGKKVATTGLARRGRPPLSTVRFKARTKK